MTGPPCIAVDRLGKRYEDTDAVRSVSFDVATGEVFAFLGPNGAGKSTTINMLCTLARPTAGTAIVAGHDIVRQPREVRRRIGLVFQETTLDHQLTVDENLRFHGVLYGMSEPDISARLIEVLELVGLADRRRDLVGKLSGGMARRLEIARGLLHCPKVLFLDEPTVGLDPESRSRIWTDVLHLRASRGVTVFMTTHYMDEAEQADRIAIIDEGEVVAIGTPSELKAAVGLDLVHLETADDTAAAHALADAGVAVEVDTSGLVASVEGVEAALPRLLALVDVPVLSVRTRRPTLDDVFLQFTNHRLAPAEPAQPPSLEAGAHRLAPLQS